jgi:hypothetical protein
MPQAPTGALIGEIGSGTSPFLIGNQVSLVASQSGMLLMRMNDQDGELFDNEGAIMVKVELK